MDTLFFIDEILCIISIFALGFFCVILPRMEIAKYFYFLFGITMFPIAIDFVLDGEPWYAYIWGFLFSAVAIIMGIILPGPNKHISKEDREQLNQQFGSIARRSGERRLFRRFLKK